MIIAIEGLMRVGKSSTIAWLKRSYPNIQTLPETLPNEWVEDCAKLKGIDHPDFFVRSDWAKSELIEKYASKKMTLMDRYYFSTIAYLLSDDESLGLYETVDLFKGVQQPDFWILIDENPLVSWERSNDQIQGEILGRWKEKDFVEKMYVMYHKLFKLVPEITPKSKTLIIQSTDLYRNRELLLNELKVRGDLCGDC